MLTLVLVALEAAAEEEEEAVEAEEEEGERGAAAAPAEAAALGVAGAMAVRDRGEGEGLQFELLAVLLLRGCDSPPALATLKEEEAGARVVVCATGEAGTEMPAAAAECTARPADDEGRLPRGGTGARVEDEEEEGGRTEGPGTVDASVRTLLLWLVPHAPTLPAALWLWLLSMVERAARHSESPAPARPTTNSEASTQRNSRATLAEHWHTCTPLSCLKVVD